MVYCAAVRVLLTPHVQRRQGSSLPNRMQYSIQYGMSPAPYHPACPVLASAVQSIGVQLTANLLYMGGNGKRL